MTTGILIAAGAEHTLAGHPEHAGRVEAIQQRLSRAGVLEQVKQIAGRQATDVELERVHSAEQIALVKYASEQGGGMIGGDTYTTASTNLEARLAAGTCCRAVEAVLSGEVNNVVSLVRPPGHHAGARSIEGFCLFNNIAIAARHAQAVFGIERIAIIDFDVHHGNGTQDIFYADNSVQFFSIHMFGQQFYPGSGRFLEDGTEQGAGYTINAPLPAGVGDRGYAQVFDELVEPLVTQFQPELILVSAGYDAHWRDPLAHMQLSLTGIDALVKRIIRYADQLCSGKLVFVLEGGYDLDVLGYGVLNLFFALLGIDDVVDPLGDAPYRETEISELLVKLKQPHLLA